MHRSTPLGILSTRTNEIVVANDVYDPCSWRLKHMKRSIVTTPKSVSTPVPMTSMGNRQAKAMLWAQQVQHEKAFTTVVLCQLLCWAVISQSSSDTNMLCISLIAGLFTTSLNCWKAVLNCITHAETYQTRTRSKRFKFIQSWELIIENRPKLPVNFKFLGF